MADAAFEDLRFDIDAVVFDNDGVLVDSDAVVETAWRRWAVARGLDPAEVLASAHGRPARATVASFTAPDEVPAALALIDELELELAATVRAVPGAVALTEALPEGRWAIVTSATRILAVTRLRASGIRLPAVLITAEDVTRGKPYPDGYAAAIRALGVEPSGVIVLEDTVSGVTAARAAGVSTVIGVSPRAQGADVTAIVADLRAVSWDGALHLAGAGRLA